MKNVYLVYIKGNIHDPFYGAPILNIFNYRNSLMFNGGIQKEDILESYDRKISISVETDPRTVIKLGQQFYISGDKWSSTIEYKLENVVVRGYPDIDRYLVNDLSDCHHKFENLFLISNEKSELNRVASEIKNKLIVGPALTYYSIDLNKTRVKKLKEDK